MILPAGTHSSAEYQLHTVRSWLVLSRRTETCMACFLQAFQADVMIAEMFTHCSALLAGTLDLPWINFWPGSPAEPFGNAPWAGSNRRMVQPNPLSYYPQFRVKGSGPTTQHLVSTSK